MSEPVKYQKMDASFGAHLPLGACNAIIVVRNEEHGDSSHICGYPMRSGDVCMNRDFHHPKEPK